MTVSVADTIQALRLVVSSMIPPPSNPDLTPDILINPVKTHPAGIGGYVGLHPSPIGEIFARRLKAKVVIRVKAETLTDLGTAESDITNTLLGADSTNLASQGVYRIARDIECRQVYHGAEDGLAVALGKDICFDIDFEFKRLPDVPSGQISTIPIDLLLHNSDGKVQTLYHEDFEVDPLSSFDAVDDAPVSNGPGAWSFDSVAGQIVQTSAISGGSDSFDPGKHGTYLVLKPSLVSKLPGDWLLQAEVGADTGGIGLVFNYQDSDNFYFFIMNLPTVYRFLGKKQSGNFFFLDSGGQDSGNAYSAGIHHLRLIQQNGVFEVAMDHTPILSARENIPPPSGSVGFLCRNCDTARFQSMRWLAL